MTTAPNPRPRKISNIRFCPPAPGRAAPKGAMLANLVVMTGSAVILGFLALAAGAVIQ